MLACRVGEVKQAEAEWCGPLTEVDGGAGEEEFDEDEDKVEGVNIQIVPVLKNGRRI